MKRKEVSDSRIEREYEKRFNKAKKLLDNPDKLETTLQKLDKKFKKLSVIGETLMLVPEMIDLVRSFIKKEYKNIPVGTIIGIISALIYVLSPIDLVPDAIPGAGLLDDASVVLLCLNSGAKDDLKKYRKWKSENKGS